MEKYLPDVVVVEAPHRFSPVGAAGDSREIARLLGGETAFINAGLQVFAYVILMRRFDEDIILHWRKGREIAESPAEIENFEHELFREALKLLKIEGSLEAHLTAHISSREEGGAGLGSSSAFMVAILLALHSFKGEQVSPEQLVEESCQIEIEILKKPMGVQDVLASIHGVFNEYRLSQDGEIRIYPIYIPEKKQEYLERNLLLFRVGGTRCTEKVLGRQKARTGKNIGIYAQLKEMVPSTRKCLENADIEGLGELMQQGWELKKQLGDVSSSTIDDIYEQALKNGAWGGRLLGAGGGRGYLVFAVPVKNQNRLRTSLNLPELPIRFARTGARVIFESYHYNTR